MSADILILLIAASSFFFFLILFILKTRRLADQAIINMIKEVFYISSGLCLGLCVYLPKTLTSLSEYIIVGICAQLLFGLAAVIFVLCIFGPNETSIRMRLISVLGKFPQGLTRETMHQYYNNQIMLRVRLKRLMGAGDITLNGNKYELKHQHNAFFIIDQCARALKYLYGIKS